MKTQADKKVLEIKKSKFLGAVEKSAKYLRLPVPKVKFWKVYNTEHFEKGERAHIHIEANRICIAETELRFMDFEEIEETAAHEVSHLKDLSHDVSFQNIKNNTKASLWGPPAGIIMVDSNLHSKENLKKKKTKKERADKSRCNYHLCRKRAKTYKCKYCGKYFCNKHKKPKPMSLFLGDDTSPTAQLIMKEYHRENAHPCHPYLRYWEKERGKKDKEYAKALDRIIKSPKPRTTSFSGPKKLVEKNIDYKWEKDEKKEKEIQIKRIPFKKKSRNFLLKHKSLIFLVFLILLFMLFWKVGFLSSWYNTIYDSVSDASIGNNFWRGVFPSKYENNAKSKQAFNSLNHLREKNNLSRMSYNSSYYLKAVHISKLIYYDGGNINVDFPYVYDKLLYDENEVPLAPEWNTLPNILNVKMSKSITYNSYRRGAVGCYKYVCAFAGEQ